MGTLQAHLVLALLLRWQPSVFGQMTTVDFRTMRFGGFSFNGAQEPAGTVLSFVAAADVMAEDIVIDLRGLEEAPVSAFASALRMGVDEVESAATRFPSERRIVLCCRTGVRAWRAARALESQGHRKLALIALG
jgi:rhodanese-related sulfurtransferase